MQHAIQKLVDVGTAADYLGTSETALRRMVHRRQVPHLKIGRRVRFSLTDLDAWIQAHVVEAITTGSK